MKNRLNRRFFCALLVFLLLHCLTLTYAQEFDSEQLYNAAIQLLTSDDSTAQDIEEGIDYLHRAALMDNTDAAFTLGYLYENGYWVEQNYSAALTCYYQCMSYNLDALYKVGYFAEYGLGIEQNLELATACYEIAAQYDHIESIKELAYLYLQDVNTPEKKAEAKSLFEKAAQLGDLDAMGRVGWCYEYGIGTEQDYKQAGVYYALALELTDEKAYYGNESTILTEKLRNILKGDSNPPGSYYKGFLTEAYYKGFYEAIYVRKHLSGQNTSNDVHIEMVMASLYPTINAEQRIKATRECIRWIYEHEPELEAQTGQLGYSQGIVYERSALAEYFYTSGYNSFENRDFIKAESDYKACINLDPKDIPARFELVEMYSLKCK